MIDVYIIMIRTRQGDVYLGAPYASREAADQEVKRIESAQGGLEVNTVWWEHRQMHLPEAAP